MENKEHFGALTQRMQAFREEGAQFTTLFTGMENPAKKIYTEAGLRPARAFTLMAKPLD